jgi:hypothetical protein
VCWPVGCMPNRCNRTWTFNMILNSHFGNMKMAVLWVVAPCSLAAVYRRCRDALCTHHQGDEVDSKLVPDCRALQPTRRPSVFI